MNTDTKQYEIAVMLNKFIKGKMPEGGDWKAYNSAFSYTPTTPYGLASEIWRGYSFCPVFSQRRKKENFKAAHHVAFDFDSGNSSLDALSQHEFINIFSSFAYSTPSSTPDNPRSRVVFIFDQPYTDLKEYERLYQALLWWLELPADPSCKDALRLFYGSPGCKVWTNWSILPRSSADFVVAEWTAQLPTVLDRPSFIIPSGGNISKVINSILDRIKSAPDGEKHTTLNRMAYVIGGYVGGGYLSQPEAVNLIRATVDAMPTVKDRQSAYTTAEIAVNDGTRSPLSLDRVLTLEEI
jgi:hypothetical protein